MIENLRKRRLEHNYTLQQMANKVGISKTYYWQIENGKRRLLYYLAEDIAEILNCTTDDLFYTHYINNLNL